MAENAFLSLPSEMNSSTIR